MGGVRLACLPGRTLRFAPDRSARSITLLVRSAPSKLVSRAYTWQDRQGRAGQLGELAYTWQDRQGRAAKGITS